MFVHTILNLFLCVCAFVTVKCLTGAVPPCSKLIGIAVYPHGNETCSFVDYLCDTDISIEVGSLTTLRMDVSRGDNTISCHWGEDYAISTDVSDFPLAEGVYEYGLGSLQNDAGNQQQKQERDRERPEIREERERE